MLQQTFLAVTGAADIIRNGSQMSADIAQAWDRHWLTIFQSTLFLSIVQVAALFAIGSLVFFMIQFIQRMTHDEDYASALVSLMLAFVIVILLSNNGFPFVQFVVALRNIMATLSNKILNVTLLDVSIKDALQGATLQGAIASQVSAQVSQCYGMVGEKQIACLQAAKEQIQQIVNESSGIPGLNLTRLLESSAVGRALQGGFEAGLPGFLGGALGSEIEDIVRMVLLAFQWGFANILELAMLLTALIGPFAVAGAFLYNGKPLWAWLTGFFALGMAQISYNIITGLVAVVVVNAAVYDTMGFLVIIGILAPALALALSAGGGMAIFHVINTGASQAMGTALSYGPAVMWRAKF